MKKNGCLGGRIGGHFKREGRGEAVRTRKEWNDPKTRQLENLPRGVRTRGTMTRLAQPNPRDICVRNLPENISAASVSENGVGRWEPLNQPLVYRAQPQCGFASRDKCPTIAHAVAPARLTPRAFTRRAAGDLQYLAASPSDDRPPRVACAARTRRCAARAARADRAALDRCGRGASPRRRPDPNGWRIFVSDRGPGIAPELVAKLFDSFRRGETHGQAGMGLGLTIASHAARLLGSELTVESKLGEGSIFSFSLPSARPEQAA